MRVFSSALFFTLTACSTGGLRATLNELGGDAYPLDERSREAGIGAACPEVALVAHRGTLLRFQPAVQVAGPFVARLQRFEQAAARIAGQTYGRAPAVVRHAGAYVCRPVRSTSVRRWSEHAFGNAIDVVGFDFDAVPRARKGTPRSARADAGAPTATPPPSLPPTLLRRFTVRVARHWQAPSDPVAQLHQRFLRALVAELVRDDVFRGLIGPPDPRHRNHLHCDMAPWQFRNL